jgi:DNA polymerase I-like protein with 3'-5' exonuclease and polymerase domains
MITTPSGRQFAFPDVERRRNGSVSHFTQIKNYPVQSFATADIVPIVLIHMENLLSTYKSCIVNSVHDSVVIDIHPEEVKQVLYLITQLNGNLKDIIENQFNIEFNVPLLLEAKIGDNWLDTIDVN